MALDITLGGLTIPEDSTRSVEDLQITQISEIYLARNLYNVFSSHQNIKQMITYKIILSKPHQISKNKISLALNRTKQLYTLSYSASKFNFESKADQNNIQVNPPSGMPWNWLKSVC